MLNALSKIRTFIRRIAFGILLIWMTGFVWKILEFDVYFHDWRSQWHFFNTYYGYFLLTGPFLVIVWNKLGTNEENK